MKTLFHGELDNVLITHLCKLRNEMAVRTAIEIWQTGEAVGISRLSVDMSEQNATDRINFVRCCIDRQDTPIDYRKTFMLLLHYSPSAFLSPSFYPVLFLDNWHH